MPPRYNYVNLSRDAVRAMGTIERYLHTCGLETALIHMVKLRASQMNGCGYCIDMHWKDLKAAGDTDQRMYSLDAWRECDYYTPRERAALAWTEALTFIAGGHAGDAVYDEVRAQFSEKELSDLTFVITTINAWNRLAIAARVEPGSYQGVKTSAQA